MRASCRRVLPSSASPALPSASSLAPLSPLLSSPLLSSTHPPPLARQAHREEREELEKAIAKEFREKQQQAASALILEGRAAAKDVADVVARGSTPPPQAGEAGGAGAAGVGDATTAFFVALAAPLPKELCGGDFADAEVEARKAREQATVALLSAIEMREEAALEAAITLAGSSYHEGQLEDGRLWVSDELKAARSLLVEERTREKKQRSFEALALEHVSAKLQCAREHPMREMPLGQDANGLTYWIFCHDPMKLWVAAPTASRDATSKDKALTYAQAKAALATKDRADYDVRKRQAKEAKKELAKAAAEAREAVASSSPGETAEGMAPGMRAKRLAAAAKEAEAADDEEAGSDDDAALAPVDDGSAWSAPCEWRWAYYERVAHVQVRGGPSLSILHWRLPSASFLDLPSSLPPSFPFPPPHLPPPPSPPRPRLLGLPAPPPLAEPCRFSRGARGRRRLDRLQKRGGAQARARRAAAVHAADGGGARRGERRARRVRDRAGRRRGVAAARPRAARAARGDAAQGRHDRRPPHALDGCHRGGSALPAHDARRRRRRGPLRARGRGGRRALPARRFRAGERFLLLHITSSIASYDLLILPPLASCPPPRIASSHRLRIASSHRLPILPPHIASSHRLLASRPHRLLPASSHRLPIGSSQVDAARFASFEKYENRAAKRGLRWTAAASATVVNMKSELIDIEDSLRGAMRQAGSKWDSRSGDRQRWLLALKRASSIEEVAEQAVLLEGALYDLGAREKVRCISPDLP